MTGGDKGMNEGSRLYNLEKQLELADMVVRLTNGHMWSVFADKVAREAGEMRRAIEREINAEKVAGKLLQGAFVPPQGVFVTPPRNQGPKGMA